MEIVLNEHPCWNLTLCSCFAGLLLISDDIEITRLAGQNFRRLYALLTIEQRKELREELRRFAEDPGAAFIEQANLLDDLANDDDFLNTIKKPG
jgi:hypothetical protein